MLTGNSPAADVVVGPDSAGPLGATVRSDVALDVVVGLDATGPLGAATVPTISVVAGVAVPLEHADASRLKTMAVRAILLFTGLLLSLEEPIRA